MSEFIGSILRIVLFLVSVTIGLFIYTQGEPITGIVVAVIIGLVGYKLIDKKYGDV